MAKDKRYAMVLVESNWHLNWTELQDALKEAFDIFKRKPFQCIMKVPVEIEPGQKLEKLPDNEIDLDIAFLCTEQEATEILQKHMSLSLFSLQIGGTTMMHPLRAKKYLAQ